MRPFGLAGRRLLGRLARRHSLAGELACVLGLYALYETTRGLVAGDRGAAIDHAREIAATERSLHVFVEPHVQAAAAAVPGLLATLGVLYLTLHLTVTGVYLLWLHRRRPAAFPVARTALLTASGLALVGFLAYPAAPPRLAGLGIDDTISHGGVDLNHGLVSALYNPYAAVPSMHVAYAAIVGASLYLHGEYRMLRVLAFLYPALQLVVIVATGNHFFFDAVAGAAVAAFSFTFAIAACAWADTPSANAVGRTPRSLPTVSRDGSLPGNLAGWKRGGGVTR
ncbi:MAG TPA: phosphatase PAP2 family protein [Gaiellaceae bacterium]|nr:phosphatase PAP2 family protein [Gaiellaceae bacterium]